MAYDNNNIFAKILRGELPCIKLYEDEHTLSFMDIMPQAEGHLLVIPKEPAETLLDLSPEGAQACMRTTQRMARAVKAALNAPGIMVAQFNGAAAGQTVPHFHFHVIPRRDGLAMMAHGAARADDAKLHQLAETIKAHIA
jgi:histidine triad (HIT) family protein